MCALIVTSISPNMKVTYRIPTEMYAYVEVEKEYQLDPSADDIVNHYQELIQSFRPKLGLPEKEWREALDRYLTSNDLEADVYVTMSDSQKNVIQQIKKSIKRVNYKNNKQENE